MVDNSAQCVDDLDCPGNLKCYEHLSWSNYSATCTCYSFYAWTGENCENYGAGTFAVVIVSASLALISLMLFVKSLQRILSFLKRKQPPGSTAVPLTPQGSPKFARKLKAVTRLFSIKKENLLKLKTQNLYIVCVLAFLLFLTHCLFVVIALFPDRLIVYGGLKRGFVGKYNEWTTVGWMSCYIWVFLQLSLSWMKIGNKANAMFSSKKNFLAKEFRNIRIMQFVFPIPVIILVALDMDIFFSAILGAPALVASAIYIQRSKTVFKNVLLEANSSEMNRQALLVGELSTKLLWSLAIFTLQGFILVYVLFLTEPGSLILLYPKPGGISFIFLIAEIMRSSAALMAIRDITNYFDDVAEKEGRTHARSQKTLVNSKSKTFMSAEDEATLRGSKITVKSV